jgi:hypothetical protein
MKAYMEKRGTAPLILNFGIKWRGKRFALLQIVEVGSGAHPASCAVGTRVLSRG